MDREQMKQDVESRIAENTIMLFMKGTADAPRCGFSAAVVQVLQQLGKPFGHKNVLEEPEYRYVLSERSNWPTIPQVFVKGKLVGGCDIVTEMFQKGELQPIVDAAFADA
jgi:monothiol glutaredoxin